MSKKRHHSLRMRSSWACDAVTVRAKRSRVREAVEGSDRARYVCRIGVSVVYERAQRGPDETRDRCARVNSIFSRYSTAREPICRCLIVMWGDARSAHSEQVPNSRTRACAMLIKRNIILLYERPPYMYVYIIGIPRFRLTDTRASTYIQLFDALDVLMPSFVWLGWCRLSCGPPGPVPWWSIPHDRTRLGTAS